MSDVWALKLSHSTKSQCHIHMHSLLVFQDMLQGWPTKLDNVNHQFVSFKVMFRFRDINFF